MTHGDFGALDVERRTGTGASLGVGEVELQLVRRDQRILQCRAGIELQDEDVLLRDDRTQILTRILQAILGGIELRFCLPDVRQISGGQPGREIESPRGRQNVGRGTKRHAADEFLLALTIARRQRRIRRRQQLAIGESQL